MKLGTAALERGQRSWFADSFLYNTLRDRLGFSKVKAAATGGSALGPDIFKFFLAMGVPLRQLYGQTELCGAYTLQRAEDGLDFDSSGPSLRQHRDQDRAPGRERRRRDRDPPSGMFKGLLQAAGNLEGDADRGWLDDDRRCRLSRRQGPAHGDRPGEGSGDHVGRRPLLAAVHREQAEVLALYWRMRGARP